MQGLSTPDYLIFLLYFILVAGYGLWIYRKKAKVETSSTDFFLAEGALTWWAIGASLIASNISAEQFIGMSGSGFKIGLAIASYEWMAAATLILVAVFFMPVYLKNRIYTMPQFLEKRFNPQVAAVMAVFWLLLYVGVNLTAILYLGALAIQSLSGLSPLWGMTGLAVFALIITIGGMKVIGFTDIIQVFFLIIGGLATTWLAVTLIAEHNGHKGFLTGLLHMPTLAADHFQMILPKNHPSFLDLPGISVVAGGMWIANLNYWGCNQYITQRALGADLKTARNGILFAAFLKLLMPVIVVLPGIAAYILFQQGYFPSEGEFNPDKAYPTLMNLLPVGLRGLSFAALTAAIVASLAGKANSIATIFTLDLYKKHFRPAAGEEELIRAGRWSIVLSLLVAVGIAPYLGIDKTGGFQMIQEYTGFLSPGIFAMFLLGLFWRKTTSAAALFAMIGGFGCSLLLKFLPEFMALDFLAPFGWSAPNAAGVYEIAFLDRMMIVFMFCITGMMLLSLGAKSKTKDDTPFRIPVEQFYPHSIFRYGSLLILLLLLIIYIYFR